MYFVLHKNYRFSLTVNIHILALYLFVFTGTNNLFSLWKLLNTERFNHFIIWSFSYYNIQISSLRYSFWMYSQTILLAITSLSNLLYGVSSDRFVFPWVLATIPFRREYIVFWLRDGIHHGRASDRLTRV